MTARIEWRSRGKGEDTLLYVAPFGEDDNTVLRKWDANPEVLTDYLNDMAGFDTKVVGLEVNVDERDSEGWGELVMTRAAQGGDVLGINPELYWDQIYYWFRAHGADPHEWSRTHQRT